MSCVRKRCYLIDWCSLFLYKISRTIGSSKFLSTKANRFGIGVCDFEICNLFRWSEFFPTLSILFYVENLLCLIVCHKLSLCLLLCLWSNLFESRLHIWIGFKLFKTTCILTFLQSKLTHSYLRSQEWNFVNGHLYVSRLVRITAKASISFALSKVMINRAVRQYNKWWCNVLCLVLLIEAILSYFGRWWRKAVSFVINRYLSFSYLSYICRSKYSLTHTVC